MKADTLGLLADFVNILGKFDIHVPIQTNYDAMKLLERFREIRYAVDDTERQVRERSQLR